MTDEERAELGERIGEKAASWPYYPPGVELNKLISKLFFQGRPGDYSHDLNLAWPLAQHHARYGGSGGIGAFEDKGIEAKGSERAVGENPAHALCIMHMRHKGNLVRDYSQTVASERGE